MRRQFDTTKIHDDTFLAALYDATPDMIYVLGPDGLLVDVNRRVEEVLGYTREEMLGTPPEHFMGDGLTLLDAGKHLDRAYAGQAEDFTWVARNKAGEDIPVEVRLRLLPTAKPGYLFAVVRDLRLQTVAENERRQRQAALQRIEESERESLDPEVLLVNVIGAVREVFAADRAWLLYPCAPEAESWSVPVEVVGPEYPGAFEAGVDYPYEDRARAVMQAALDAPGAQVYFPKPGEAEWADRFQVRSQMTVAVRPRLGPAWLLGLHQCSAARVWTDTEQELLAEIGQRMAHLLDAVAEQRRRQAQEARLTRFQRILGEVARAAGPAEAPDLHTALRPYTEAGVRALAVGRVSVWLFNAAHDAIECLDLYQSHEKAHRQGLVLSAEDYPAYFSALEENRVIDAEDALNDPQTREFSQAYLLPLGIGAMLDAPLRVGGRLVGVLCCEHLGESRQWRPSERGFATSLADQVALALDYWQRREAEARLNEAQRLAHIGSWELHLVHDRLWWSAEVSRIFELALGSGASYQTFLDLVHPEDRTAVDAAYRNAVAAGVPYRISHRLRMSDGRIKYVEERGETYYAEDGTPLRSVGTVQDITEQTLTEQAVLRSQAEFRAIVESISDAVIFVDPQRRMARLNPAVSEKFGYREDELLGHTTEMLYANPADYAAQGSEHFHPDVKPGESLSPYEMRYRRKDGSEFVGETLGTLVTDAQGNLLGYIGVIRDVTERKMAEAALRTQIQLNRQILQATQVGYILADTEGRIREVNPAYCAMLGYAAEELLAMNLRDIEFERDAEKVARHIQEILHNGRARFESVHRRKDGGRVELDVSITLTGDGPLVAAFVQDISERKAYAARLESAVARRTLELSTALEELQAFSYSVSHDLRGPLRAIDGFSQALLDDYAPQLDDTAQDYLARIRRGTQRMGAIIDDLLNLSRISRTELRRRPVDMSALAHEVAEEIQARDPARAFHWQIDPDLQAEGDPSLLRVVLENLFSNAWKYTAPVEYPELHFGGYTRDGERIFYVCDNGVGFDMRYADKLFNAFQRLHSKDQFEGTGIGLATVDRIIGRHGGRVWAESVSGAAFYFTLG